MKQTFYLRYPSDDDHIEWLVEEPPGPPRLVRGSLAELAQHAHEARVVVFVPGTDVAIAQARLPTRKRQRMLQALPYALEEQLATDVDDLHFAIGAERPDGVLAAAVTRERMSGWLSTLRERGIEPARLIPESAVLPVTEGEWSLLVESDRTVLRTGPGSAVAFDSASPQELMAMALAAGDPPGRLRLFDCREDKRAPLLFEGIETVAGECRQGVLDVLVTGLKGEARPLDLLQGEFSRRDVNRKRWQQWRSAAVLAGVLVAVQAGLGIAHWQRLSHSDTELASQIDTLYRQTFPDAHRVVNARVQMEQQLAALRGGGANDGFVAVLGRTAPILKQDPALKIAGMRYRDGQLELDVTLSDLQALDRLKQKLSDTGLTVQIVSASAKDGRVESRLTVQGGRA